MAVSTRHSRGLLCRRSLVVAAAWIAVIGWAGSAPARAAAGDDSPVGLWQTLDDATGQPKALVRIVQGSDGALSGQVVRGFGANDTPDRRCTACTDARKDQPIAGMTILSGMKKDGDQWRGGQILDPENGKVYHCEMHLESGGQKLVVRGYVGVPLLGRSQVWSRQASP